MVGTKPKAFLSGAGLVWRRQRASVTHALRQIEGESVALVESAKRQKAGVTTDLPTGKISANGSLSVEGKGQLWYTVCHAMDAPKGNAGLPKTQCSSTF